MIKAIKVGIQIEASHIEEGGTFSTPPLVQSMPPRLGGIPYGVMMILQVLWTEVMIKLAMLEAKVGYIEGRVKIGSTHSLRAKIDESKGAWMHLN